MSAFPLEIKNLVKDFGPLRAIADVSFTIKPATIFGLLGANGAGKTTIISCISSLVDPTSGSISIFGNDVRKNSFEAKKLLGVVPQELIHHGYFTVEEILKIHSSYYGISKNLEHIHYLLKKLDLFQHKNKLVNQLSGGMKRRLLIAKALVHKPKLLLLDEPTAGVDVDLKYTLWNFIRELKESGTSILLTTHYLEEAELLCDEIGFLQTGKMRYMDNLINIMDTMSSKRITIVLNNNETELKHKMLNQRDGRHYSFLVPKKYTLPQLLKELGITVEVISDIHIREGSLEDVFLKIINEDE